MPIAKRKPPEQVTLQASNDSCRVSQELGRPHPWLLRAIRLLESRIDEKRVDLSRNGGELIRLAGKVTGVLHRLSPETRIDPCQL
jgi:hypothetical protein